MKLPIVTKEFVDHYNKYCADIFLDDWKIINHFVVNTSRNTNFLKKYGVLGYIYSKVYNMSKKINGASPFHWYFLYYMEEDETREFVDILQRLQHYVWDNSISLDQLINALMSVIELQNYSELSTRKNNTTYTTDIINSWWGLYKNELVNLIAYITYQEMKKFIDGDF